MLSKIFQMKVGGIDMHFRSSKGFCEEFGLHHGKGACYKFIKERRMRADLSCQCGNNRTGTGSRTGSKHYKRKGQEDFNPFPAPEISTFVITSLSSQNLCKAHFF
jgi:hypothetical protein